MRRSISLTLAAALALVAPVASRAADDIVVNMHDVELSDVAEQISRLTGRTLILDPSVKGTVNVISAEPLSSAGVWDLFQSVLRVHGFAAVRSGRAWRIVPQASAIQGGAALGAGAGSQQVVTSMVRLRNLPSDTAARVFKPLVAAFGSLEPLTDPNAIVITDYADNVRRIEALARSLDGGGGNAFDTITLRYASARDVASALRGLLGEEGGAGGPRIAVDERSNTVLFRGDAASLATARSVAARLDKPGGATPVTKMYRLSNADAESVTDVLRGVMGGGGGEATNPVARSLSSSGDRTIGAGAVGLGAVNNGANGNGNATTAALLGNSLSGNANGQSGYNGSLGTGFGSGSGSGGDDFPTGRGASGSSGAAGFSTPELTVQPAPELNAIVLRGTPAAIAAIEPLIAQLDVRRPQVMIEAAIVEVTGDVGDELGIQLGFGNAAAIGTSGAASSFNNQGLSLTNILTALGSPVSVGLLDQGFSGVYSHNNDFGILVQALSQSSKANLLSTPSLTTLDNQPAEIVVGQNVPFRTGSFTTSGNTLNPFTTIERQDVGITLKVVPRIHDGNVIRLDVSQEVSSLVGAVTGAADLITNRRSIQTTVLADDGQTIVLGGLISDDRTTQRSAVPILGDIPGLGLLFRNKRETQTKRTLFVFLRPTVLRDRAAITAAAEDKYGRVRYQESINGRNSSLLLNPPRPRLSTELRGVY